MGDAPLFLLVMIAVAWLCAWVMRDPGKPSRRFWPFDMRAPEPGETGAPPRAASGTRRHGLRRVGR